MSWNGSGDKNAANVPKETVKTPPSKWRGLAALLVIVVGGLAAWFALRPAEPEQAAKRAAKDTKREIAEAEPQVAAAREAEVQSEREKPKKVPYWKLPSTNGFTEAQIRKWKFMHEPPPRYTNNAAFHRPPPAYAIFRHRSENELAMLMTMEPGSTLVGSPMYDDRMREDFLKSCEEPITPTDDDTEEQKALKRQMNQVKIDIRERMRNGEDFCDILRETREEMMRLSRIKREMQADLSAMLKEVDSAEDAAVCIEAANKLLESKGIAPLPDNPIIRRRLEMQFAKRKQQKDDNK